MTDPAKAGRRSRRKGARRERELARIMGGKRGRAFSGEADITIPGFYAVSVKSRKRWPKWVYANPHDGMVPFLSCPEDARILSAGGPVAAHTAILRTWWGNSEPQTVPLRLP